MAGGSLGLYEVIQAEHLEACRVTSSLLISGYLSRGCNLGRSMRDSSWSSNL